MLRKDLSGGASTEKYKSPEVLHHSLFQAINQVAVSIVSTLPSNVVLPEDSAKLQELFEAAAFISIVTRLGVADVFVETYNLLDPSVHLQSSITKGGSRNEASALQRNPSWSSDHSSSQRQIPPSDARDVSSQSAIKAELLKLCGQDAETTVNVQSVERKVDAARRLEKTGSSEKGMSSNILAAIEALQGNKPVITSLADGMPISQPCSFDQLAPSLLPLNVYQFSSETACCPAVLCVPLPETSQLCEAFNSPSAIGGAATSANRPSSCIAVSCETSHPDTHRKSLAKLVILANLLGPLLHSQLQAAQGSNPTHTHPTSLACAPSAGPAMLQHPALPDMGVISPFRSSQVPLPDFPSLPSSSSGLPLCVVPNTGLRQAPKVQLKPEDIRSGNQAGASLMMAGRAGSMKCPSNHLTQSSGISSHDASWLSNFGSFAAANAPAIPTSLPSIINRQLSGSFQADAPQGRTLDQLQRLVAGSFSGASLSDQGRAKRLRLDPSASELGAHQASGSQVVGSAVQHHGHEAMLSQLETSALEVDVQPNSGVAAVASAMGLNDAQKAALINVLRGGSISRASSGLSDDTNHLGHRLLSGHVGGPVGQLYQQASGAGGMGAPPVHNPAGSAGRVSLTAAHLFQQLEGPGQLSGDEALGAHGAPSSSGQADLVRPLDSARGLVPQSSGSVSCTGTPKTAQPVQNEPAASMQPVDLMFALLQQLSNPKDG